MEDILRNGLYALIEQPRPVSILALPKLLTDTAYRATVLAEVTNPAVLDFFHNTYDRWENRFREEAISAGAQQVPGIHDRSPSPRGDRPDPIEL